MRRKGGDKVLVLGLIAHVLARRRRLLDAADDAALRLVLSYTGVPSTTVQVGRRGSGGGGAEKDLLVLGGGCQSRKVTARDLLQGYDGGPDRLALATHLSAQWGHLRREDLVELATAVLPHLGAQLSVTDRVYYALKALGRPSHYSQVRLQHNAMFPDRPMGDHAVHAALLRGLRGIVWIGLKGTYALSEDGFQRPSQGLHDAVEEIVARLYAETGRPVPFEVVLTELGKYRAVVNRASAMMALVHHPAVRQMGKGLFAPSGGPDGDETGPDQDRLDEDRLDEVLRMFSKSQGKTVP